MEREKHKITINTPDPGYEPFPVSIMNRSTHEIISFDPHSGRPATISYRLNKTGTIRIRLVRRDLPSLILRTLMDWTVQDFGTYEMKWDGTDSSGNIVDNKKVQAVFEAKDQGNGLQHLRHEPADCRDPIISLDVEGNGSGNSAGALRGRIVFDDSFRGSASSSAWEVRYFVDYGHVGTEKFETGNQDLGFSLNIEELTQGDHLVSVTVNDGCDHVGSAGIRITVGP